MREFRTAVDDVEEMLLEIQAARAQSEATDVQQPAEELQREGGEAGARTQPEQTCATGGWAQSEAADVQQPAELQREGGEAGARTQPEQTCGWAQSAAESESQQPAASEELHPLRVCPAASRLSVKTPRPLGPGFGPSNFL